jgi:hypothetical protein
VTAVQIEPAEARSRRDVVVRLATPHDDAARCSLFADVNMESDLVLSVRRDPDFDALYRLQTSTWESWVVEINGRIEGMGTVLARDAYAGGERCRAGYLGDLRFSPRAEGRMLLDRLYGPLLDGAAARLGCDAFLTAVIRSNARALRALTVSNERSKRRGRPVYSPLLDFDIRSLHLLTIPRARRSGDLHVRRATEGDVPRIARLLDADARGRPFGYPISELELRRRLATWPGLRVESFYLAEDRSGGLLGVIALWDAAPVKRMIVKTYRGSMRRVRLAYDLAARVLGRRPLPRPGSALRYVYVTHQAVPSGDPTVLRALLAAVASDARAADYYFVCICAPAGDIADVATRGFVRSNLPARLYAVTSPSRAVDPAWYGVRPGFEMALV